MLRLLIIAILIYGAYLGISSFNAGDKPAAKKSAPATTPAPVASVDLPGMPFQLEPAFEAARQSGPATLKKWIEAHRKYLRDPRLGDIELDYAVSVARQNSAEAKAIFRAVKARTPADSPLQARLRAMSRTFE